MTGKLITGIEGDIRKFYQSIVDGPLAVASFPSCPRRSLLIYCLGSSSFPHAVFPAPLLPAAASRSLPLPQPLSLSLSLSLSLEKEEESGGPEGEGLALGVGGAVSDTPSVARKSSCKEGERGVRRCPARKHPHKVRFIYRKSVPRRISSACMRYARCKLVQCGSINAKPSRPDLFLNSPRARTPRLVGERGVSFPGTGGGLEGGVGRRRAASGGRERRERIRGRKLRRLYVRTRTVRIRAPRVLSISVCHVSAQTRNVYKWDEGPRGREASRYFYRVARHWTNRGKSY
jgi:hypothetical protein